MVNKIHPLFKGEGEKDHEKCKKIEKIYTEMIHRCAFAVKNMLLVFMNDGRLLSRGQQNSFDMITWLL